MAPAYKPVCYISVTGSFFALFWRSRGGRRETRGILTKTIKVLLSHLESTYKGTR